MLLTVGVVGFIGIIGDSLTSAVAVQSSRLDFTLEIVASSASN